jgi:16S rRNA (cytosine967-C5)-methyltransferase
MSLAGSQQKVFLRLVATLRPHWRRDANLPSRIQELFAANRSFGSRDRRLYRELIYTTLRYLPWIEPLLDSDPHLAAQTVAWLAADLPATRAFRAALCGDWPACPPTVAAKAAQLNTSADDLLPAWVSRHCPEAAIAPDLDALHTRAPLWLRLQTPDAKTVLDEFAAKAWAWQRSEILPTAVQLLSEADVTKTDAWEKGLFEVQDLGSQLILETAGIAPGGRWLDACAGAGGKTLQLAALLGPTGQIDAHDIRPSALRELTLRAARSDPTVCHLIDDKLHKMPRAAISVCHLLDDKQIGDSAGAVRGYDGVLVDAPCSGSGTWRRAPQLKWTTSAGGVTQAADQQLALLRRFSALVRPGGQLIYATCSLSRMENEEVVAAFLAEAAGEVFEPILSARTFDTKPRKVGLAILPARHNTDGFYVASLRRKN